MKPIGYVQSCYPDKFGTPRQPGLVAKAWAEIHFYPEIQAELALEGLEGFSHLWVIFTFHKNETARYHAKVHPPRLGGRAVGVFATRSPHRPNPIGLSLVEIVSVDHNKVIISGADIIDGTPVLDIKPYIPEVESRPTACAGWPAETKQKQISIEWSNEQVDKITNWAQRIGQPDLHEIIEKTIQLDPRPVVYRGYEGQESPYRDRHAIRFFDGDVHFKFLTPDKIQILEVICP